MNITITALDLTRRAAAFGPLAAIAAPAKPAGRDALQTIIDALAENDRIMCATPESDAAAENRFISTFRDLQARLAQTPPTTCESAVDGLRYLVKVSEDFELFDREEELALFRNCIAILARRM